MTHKKIATIVLIWRLLWVVLGVLSPLWIAYRYPTIEGYWMIAAMTFAFYIGCIDINVFFREVPTDKQEGQTS